ncbi:hypothetical protein [Singulisphaera acidiphila]|uniref:Uncharacterized protein n=1 Tax=Singulisphaera acidiphila (strain ATCC BAA-1392 / DSM 18658 / VKM B-2454 / MOB10) TaxID=886293 RepID=L0DIN7_SINAD|nr:hypothetical protein [Singulisphaera acidiphila]AGA28511.1 hypothetical protein Sinac_4313 [Singulisphaera acidiphila DSM 18658]
MSKRFKATLAGRAKLKSIIDPRKVSKPTIPAARENDKVCERACRANQTPAHCLRSQELNMQTGQREYCSAKLEFMRAIQEHQQSSGRLYPTWHEVLEVLKKMGLH